MYYTMENIIELNGSLKKLHIESILISVIVEEIQKLFPNIGTVKDNTLTIDGTSAINQNNPQITVVEGAVVEGTDRNLL